MPQQKWHCLKCGHGFGDEAMAQNCEEGHTSIVSHKNKRVAEITEKYDDLQELPSTIIVRRLGGLITTYRVVQG